MELAGDVVGAGGVLAEPASLRLPAVGVPTKAIAARPASPAMTSAQTEFLMPAASPTLTGALQVSPAVVETETAGLPSPSTYPKKTLPARSAATDGSVALGVEPVTGLTFQVPPASVLTARPCVLPQDLLGR